jgi:hypothetical protein
LKIGVVPTSDPTIRGSQAMRVSTSKPTTAASQRSAGNGRFPATQAMPGTINASATVSQPFSSAMVSASASAAIAPVANSAPAAARPGRGARLSNVSVASA